MQQQFEDRLKHEMEEVTHNLVGEPEDAVDCASGLAEQFPVRLVDFEAFPRCAPQVVPRGRRNAEPVHSTDADPRNGRSIH